MTKRGIGVPVTVGVGVAPAVAVGVGVAVAPPAVGVTVGVGVLVGVGTSVGVRVAVLVGVMVAPCFTEMTTRGRSAAIPYSLERKFENVLQLPYGLEAHDGSSLSVIVCGYPAVISGRKSIMSTSPGTGVP